MFKCQKCNSLVGPGVPQIVRVVQIRERAYPVRYKGEGENHRVED